MERRIQFYRTASGQCPVEEFLDSLESRQARKVTWVLQLIEELERIPRQYFKRLSGTDGLWEIRVVTGGDAIRFLAFQDGENLVVLAHGFLKKSRKLPKGMIDTATLRRKDYFSRR